MSVTVLRLGHRPQRDKRLTTHLILAARAFGAEKVIYSGVMDTKMEERIRSVVKEWGGKFTLEYNENWRKIVKGFEGEVIHLTMYGLPVQDNIATLRDNPGRKLVIVGGSKVPREVYDEVDWNIAITSQPHSEVSALAVFLDLFFNNSELNKKFENPHLSIKPSERGKDVTITQQRLSQTKEHN